MGKPAIRLDVHGPTSSLRRIRHFMPTTGVPAPQDPHNATDREDSGGDQRRPREYLNQPDAPLSSDDSLLCVPKPGQLVHVLRDAHERFGETRLTRRGPQSARRPTRVLVGNSRRSLIVIVSPRAAWTRR